MFLLGTDHIGIIQRKTEPEFSRLRARASRYPRSAFYWPIVSFQEQVMGWNGYLNRARDSRGVVHAYLMFENILLDFAAAQLASFDDAAVTQFDSLRAQKVRLATLDLRIGSIALARDFTVLTRNLADFRRVPALRVEDWCA